MGLSTSQAKQPGNSGKVHCLELKCAGTQLGNISSMNLNQMTPSVTHDKPTAPMVNGMLAKKTSTVAHHVEQVVVAGCVAS